MEVKIHCKAAECVYSEEDRCILTSIVIDWNGRERPLCTTFYHRKWAKKDRGIDAKSLQKLFDKD